MIYTELFDWQQSIINKYACRDSFGLFVGCGMGKTPLCLALAESNHIQNIIIVSIKSKTTEPKTLSGSWLWWAEKIDYKPNIYLVNYESLFEHNTDDRGIILKKPILDFINSAKDNLAIICDESHKIKDTSSKQTKALFKIQSYAKVKKLKVYTYLATGTPFTIGYIDLYTQLKILGLPMNKTEFKDKFCILDNRHGLLGWQQPIKGYKNTNELFEIVHKYALTLNSEEVLTLPEKTFIFHFLCTSSIFTLFTKENAKIPPNLVSNAKINPYYRCLDKRWIADTSASFWLRSRQLSIGFQGNAEESKWFDHSRLEELERFITNEKGNYIVFYNFTTELIELFNIFERQNYNIDVYSGEIKSLTFYDKYESQTETERLTNNNNVILANFASGSTGKNWQLYNQCIMFSLPLFKDWEQSLKRIHRIGQNKAVVYHVFLSDNFLDKSMWKSLQDGVQYTDKLFERDIKNENS